MNAVPLSAAVLGWFGPGVLCICISWVRLLSTLVQCLCITDLCEAELRLSMQTHVLHGPVPACWVIRAFMMLRLTRCGTYICTVAFAKSKQCIAVTYVL